MRKRSQGTFSIESSDHALTASTVPSYRMLRRMLNTDLASRVMHACRTTCSFRPVRFRLHATAPFLCCLRGEGDATTKGELVYLIYESADIPDCWIREGKAYCFVENVNHVKPGA